MRGIRTVNALPWPGSVTVRFYCPCMHLRQPSDESQPESKSTGMAIG